ncbi:hypothetical Protein MAMP_00264 [Methylophaga aminisulfidivorans MP]|uniref:Cytoplasmic protein n=1 Tax=Methylophaga aminisulfidivorans MP TaxID=1026882 RepID=F5T1I2_9GAMM|nr:DUF1788 domain-containing protein [Methylophaga aminisulfidivorans]EGL53078.1 hypothetical Protein MAMP_00264 [Methylophaga aminisulfidivorans MP]
MSTPVTRKNIDDNYEHIFNVVSGKRFRNKQSLNNEIPFFICPYDPAIAVEMERLQARLTKRLEKAGVSILEINLYDQAIEILKERGIWEQIFEVEPTVSKDELIELFQNVLDPAANLIPAIAEKLANSEFDVLFISGVGEVFPYIRSHNVLNNLQSTAKDKPTLMFFPGMYTHSLETGASLDLFGRLHDDKYYRAFNILDVEP